MTVSSNFHGISTGISLYGIMFVIQGGGQGQKVIFNKYKYNTYFLCDFECRIHLW